MKEDLLSPDGQPNYALLQADDTKAAYAIEDEFVTIGRLSESTDVRPTITIAGTSHYVSRKHVALSYRDGTFILTNIGCNDVTVVFPSGVVKKLEGGHAVAEERARRFKGANPATSVEIKIGTIIELTAHGPKLILARRMSRSVARSSRPQ